MHDLIDDFCNELQEVGREHKIQVLAEYALGLKNDIKLFDIVAIEKKFKILPEEIENLITQMENVNPIIA